jgi:uncharacterized protein YbbC (DUF1343 family)
MYTNEFKWKEPPYEYVYDQNPFDVISGTDSIRKGIEQGSSLSEISATWPDRIADFKSIREKFLLY